MVTNRPMPKKPSTFGNVVACKMSVTYATGAVFAPQDAISQMQYSSNLVATSIYNHRLQPCWIFATTGAALPVMRRGSDDCSGRLPIESSIGTPKRACLVNASIAR
jgi:hypothetical protein